MFTNIQNITYMDNLKNQLEEKLKNNIHKLTIDEVKKIMDILNSNQEKTIKNTTKKLIKNKPIKIFRKDREYTTYQEDQNGSLKYKSSNKINKINKKIINTDKKLSKGGDKHLIRNIRFLDKKEKEILRKKEFKKLKNIKIDINENKKDNKNEIVKGDYFKIKENANYFRNVIRSREYKINTSIKIVDENIFLEILKDEVVEDIDNIRNELNENIKCIFVLVVRFSKKVQGEEELTDIVYFHHNHTIKKLKEQGLKSQAETKIYSNQDIVKIYDDLPKLFTELIDNHNRKGSGWTVDEILMLRADISKLESFTGASYIPLPEIISKKKCCINPKNLKDNKCFTYSFIIGKHHKEIKNHPEEIYNLRKYEENINTSSLIYPVSIDQIEEFEKLNNIPINVYQYKKDDRMNVLYSHKISSHNNIIDMLLIKEGDKSHYVFIKNLNGLWKSGTNSRFLCNKCLQSFSTELAYENHKLKNRCVEFNGDAVKILPKEGENITEFKRYNQCLMKPFVIYYDIESELQEITDENKLNHYQQHIAKNMGITIISRYPDLLKSKYIQFNGKDCIIDGLNWIMNKKFKINDVLKNTNFDITMSNEDEILFQKTNKCWMCNCNFINEEEKKVRDHDHLKKENNFRGAACNECNLQANFKNFKLNIIAHNAKNYDAHFIFQYIGLLNKKREENDKKKKIKINAIPLTDQKYLSFEVNGCVFLDSNQFMISSLEKLIKCLNDAKDEKLFKHFNEHYKNKTEEQRHLLRQKGFFPYDYYKNEEVLLKGLPRRKEFYNKLNNKNITKKEYEHVKNVYEKLDCKNFSDYLNLYLECDVILLADVFENFRNTCYSNYGIDCIYSMTAPALSWQAMLYGKFRKNIIKGYDYIYDENHKTKLISFKEGQEEMLDFIKENQRGGISLITQRYAKANNYYLDDFDSKIPTSFIKYWDCNNLYGYAMVENLPSGNYEWNKEIWTNEKLMNISEDNDIGYILEVDIHVPKEKHDYFNDYPLAVQNTHFEDSEYMKNVAIKLNIKKSKTPVDKLIPNLYDKTKYVIHYRNLKLMLSLGYEIIKYHRVLQFEQKPILKDFIMFNTFQRAATNQTHEKDFFKLMNNSIFGKTLQNVERQIDIKFCNTDEQLLKQISKPHYKSYNIFPNGIAAVHMNKTQIKYNMPIIIGFCVLELSKLKMADFHYNVIKKMYNERAKLLFTDTDSLTYHIETKDIDKDLYKIRNNFDFSNYEKNHTLYDESNKNMIGYFKDENGSFIVKEFCGIRSKVYIMTTQKYDKETNYECDDKKNVLKGMKTVVSKELTIEDYKNCIFNETTQNHSYNNIVSIDHNLTTRKINKVSLSAFDDKKYYLDAVQSRSHGHYLN